MNVVNQSTHTERKQRAILYQRNCVKVKLYFEVKKKKKINVMISGNFDF